MIGITCSVWVTEEVSDRRFRCVLAMVGGVGTPSAGNTHHPNSVNHHNQHPHPQYHTTPRTCKQKRVVMLAPWHTTHNHKTHPHKRHRQGLNLPR
jgi:hypothetical protein